MALEVLIVCVFLYLLLSPIVSATVELIVEKARKMELENDATEQQLADDT